MPNEIVIIAGPPAGGKSTVVQEYTRQGYTRINRDEIGGSLKAGSDSYKILRQEFLEGSRRFVLDNVYATAESRAPVIALGKELGLPVGCVWLATTREQAQFFAARRQVQRYGRILRVEEYKTHRGDPNMFPPVVQFAYWKKVQEPMLAEGLAWVTHRKTTITLGQEYKNRALIFDYDGTLRLTKSGRPYPNDPEDVVLMDRRRDLIQRREKEGWHILGASNQSGISKEPGEDKYVSEAGAIRCFERTNELLGVKIDYIYSSERGGVPQTYWPKPMPGMGVYFIEKYRLDPQQTIYVGDMTKDRTFAERCGFQFALASEFFGD